MEIVLAQRRLRVHVLGNVGCVSGDGVAAGDEGHAQRLDSAGNNNADMGRGRGRVREDKACGGSVVPPPAK